MTDRFPVEHREYREAYARDDKCPECGGELDTGFECNDCGADAIEIINKLPKEPNKKASDT